MAAEAFREGSMWVGRRRHWPRRQSGGEGPESKAADGKRAALPAAGREDTSPPDEDPAAALVAPAEGY